MIELARHAVAEMVEHAARESPREACGLLLKDMTVIQMWNVAESDNEFAFDSAQQLTVFTMLNVDAVLAVYHSHPLHIGTRPSQPDISQHWPEETHMIITCGTDIAAYLNGEKVEIRYVD